MIGIFGAVQKKSSSTTFDRENPELALGKIISHNDLAKDRSYVRYTIRGTGERYWLGSIADRFRIAGGWRRIAQTTLKQQGKQSTDQEVSEMQYRVEVGQQVLIPIWMGGDLISLFSQSILASGGSVGS
ncbi:MAG: hypothetical protein ACREA9_22010 [Pyrinomonadaceae bacterium]